MARASAEAVCELPGLGVFAEVPLSLSVEIYEDLFKLDPGRFWTWSAMWGFSLRSVACALREKGGWVGGGRAGRLRAVGPSRSVSSHAVCLFPGCRKADLRND